MIPIAGFMVQEDFAMLLLILEETLDKYPSLLVVKPAVGVFDSIFWVVSQNQRAA